MLFHLADFSVLFITIHGAIQVYRPRVDPHDPRYGLNPLRLYINSFLATVPFLLASLAFLNPQGAYEYNAGVCWLPIQPVWYRLALSWIPRYMIFVTILVLSFTVYFHVGNQFDSFQKLWSSSRRESHLHRWRQHLGNHDSKYGTPTARSPNDGVSIEIPTPLRTMSDEVTAAHRHVALDENRRSSKTTGKSARRTDTDEEIEMIADREENLQNLAERLDNGEGLPITGSGIPLETFSRSANPLSAQRDSFPSTTHEGKEALRTKSGPGRLMRSAFRGASEPLEAPLERYHPDTEGNIGENAANDMLEAKRATIMLQIRMNFTYHIIYVALWILPFVLHCMQYKADFARDPPSGLAALSILCISSMGFANCLIFLVREQPWRILGTFPDWLCSWNCSVRDRRSSSSSGNNTNDFLGTDNTRLRIEPGNSTRRSSASTVVPPGYFSNIKWPSSSRSRYVEEDPRKMKNLNFSAQTSAKASARLRLAFERADRRAEVNAEVADDASNSANYQTATIGKNGVGVSRNWWERGFISSSGLPLEDDESFIYP
jgi:G protein-coupled receptor GPR1